MQISCPQASLRQALATVVRAARPTSGLAILGTVLLETTDEGALCLSATDLEVAIITQITDARVEAPGALAVPARLLHEFVGSLTQETVGLTGDDQALKVTSRGAKATIMGLAAADFPSLPAVDDLTPLAALPAGRLREMIRQTVFAAAPAGSPRPELTGLLVRVAGGRLTLVATDGLRLAQRGGDLHEPVPEPTDVIVPARALTELAALLDTGEATVTLALAQDRACLCFVAPTFLLIARLIAATFPNHEAVLPPRWTTRLVVDGAELALAAERAGLFERRTDPRVRLAASAGQPLLVAARGEDTGESATEVPAAVAGAPLALELNVRYLREALRALGARPVALESAGPTAPCVLRPDGDDSTLQVIMPYGPMAAASATTAAA